MTRIAKYLFSFFAAEVMAALFCISSISYAANTLNTDSNSDVHVVWKRAPIEVTLPVGKERFVTFPSGVKFGYNKNLLPSSVLSVENDNQTLYFDAKKPFKTQRTEVKLNDGEIILLDINAKKNANDNPVDIVFPKKVKSITTTTDQSVSRSSVTYVTLIRYAVQQLYSPERLLKQSSSITRFPMETAHTVPIFYDDSVSAMPLASWQGGDYFVTAVFIENLLNQPLKLDPRLICGDWKTASFYPQTTLSSHGTPINQDATTLFIVSDKPFSEAIQSCLN